jgi:hypothetical protein
MTGPIAAAMRSAVSARMSEIFMPVTYARWDK